MKAVMSMTLGVMTAIGGFVDIGNLVTSGITGARFGMTLTWAVLVGTIGMALFAEMAGRVTAVTRKPIFHVVRERLGVRVSLVNAAASTLLNVLTLAAEIGGVSLVLQDGDRDQLPDLGPAGRAGRLAGDLADAVPVDGEHLRPARPGPDRVRGGAVPPADGLACAVAPGHYPAVPAGQPAPTWWFYAVTLIGACIVPYQVIFFSSGAGRKAGPARA